MDVEAGGEDGGGDRKFEHGWDWGGGSWRGVLEEEESVEREVKDLTIWVEEMVRERKDAAEGEEDEEENEKLW